MFRHSYNRILSILCCSFWLSFTPLVAQIPSNVRLVAQVDYPEICNDIWGYVDPMTATEYAIMGTVEGTIIFSLENPAAPREIAYIRGAFSTWRDIKHYGHHLYVTTDSGADGLLIIDMSEAPDNISHHFWQPTLTIGSFTRQLEACHNLYIDQQTGFAYLSGCNIGAVIMLDLRDDPKQPVFVGATNDRYSHDNYARGDTLFSADINKGEFSIYDIQDRSNPQMIARQSTSFGFTHNIWPSDDTRFVFTTDEEPNAYVESYDISDLNNIRRLDRYRPKDTEGLDVIPHNTHYHDGYLVTSWYTDGLKIIDAHRPGNLIEVGHYDTHSEYTSGFHGCWGAFPYLPSGLVLASDQESGLFVFEVDYQRAAYLEGRVTHALSGIPLNKVSIKILSDIPNEELSRASGDYQTGLASPGTYQVVFSKEGYFPDTVELSLQIGEVVEWDQQLEPEATFGGRVIQSSDGSGVANARIVIFNEDLDLYFETDCDSLGNFDMPTFVPEDYQLVAGQWGYRHANLQRTINPNDRITMVLDKGYQDDFLFDLNWQVEGDAVDGHWELGNPKGIAFNGAFSHPNVDANNDIGRSAYTTGNQGIQLIDDDVDLGTTILSSPMMDLREYDDPVIHYQYWFYNRIRANNGLEDTLKVWVSNGQDTMLLDVLYQSIPEWFVGPERSLSDYLEITDQMQVIFSVQELVNESLIEAGIDAFWVEDRSTTSTSAPSTLYSLKLYPTPCTSSCHLDYQTSMPLPGYLEIYNALGQRLEQQEVLAPEGSIILGSTLPPGLYFVRLTSAKEHSPSLRLLKH